MKSKAVFALFVSGIIFFFFGTILWKPQEDKNGGIISGSPSHALEKEMFYKVHQIVDGDTIKIEIDGKNTPVRLIGIDAPETDARKNIECFGREASRKAWELLSGKSVLLKSDSSQADTDKYGRLLRYVFLENGTFVNKYMVAEGYGHEYTYRGNPYKYQQEFIQAEREAREQKKGLWGNACKRD